MGTMCSMERLFTYLGITQRHENAYPFKWSGNEVGDKLEEGPVFFVVPSLIRILLYLKLNLNIGNRLTNMAYGYQIKLINIYSLIKIM